MKSAILAPAALIALLVAGAVGAQTRDPARDPVLTLYAGANFQGAAKSFGLGIDDLARQGFNDRARSARVQGRWRLCESRGLRGRCVEVTGDVPDLAALQLAGAVSSFEMLGRAENGRPFAGFGGVGVPSLPGLRPREAAPATAAPAPAPAANSRAGRSLDGRTVSFFPEPPPGAHRNGDDFCRAMGFAGLVYADTRDGGLRDVVCRR